MLKVKKEDAGSDKLSVQFAILDRAEKEDIHLTTILEKYDWTYDDLIYERSQKLLWRGPKPLSLKHISSTLSKPNKVPVVSFFTGCGGMDLGFEAAGFKHVAAFEFNELFCKTLRKNRPSWKIFGPPIHSGDVSKHDEVVSALSKIIETPFEGVFIGGPPCQPFSIASNQRFSKSGENFKRTGFDHEKNGNLLFDYVKLIIEFKPQAFVIENVPGLRDLDGGEQLSIAIGELRKQGYTV